MPRRCGSTLQVRVLLPGFAALTWFALVWGFSKLALAQYPESRLVQEGGVVGNVEAGAPSEQAQQQSFGYISGTVSDKAGAVAVGAELQLTPQGQSLMQQQFSGEHGEFFYAHVPTGPFQLTIKAKGFETQQFFGVLHAGETYLVPKLKLAFAGVATTVMVQARLTPTEVADDQIREQERQRVLGFIPNFYVSYARNPRPLNAQQKFRLAWKTTADPFTFVGVLAIAGVKQATNAVPGFGQGAQGYAKRFGATYTDVVTGTFIGSAILPSLLKQDPRYFYKGTGSTRTRVLYALASPIICKGDNMRWQPNYSNVIGTFASASLSYLYYPRSDRNGAVLMFQNSFIRLGETAFEGVLQEFLIRRLTPHLTKRASDQR